MLQPTYAIPSLPLAVDLETRPVLKALVSAKSALALVRGSARTVPNQGILIDTLAIQEARASSEIENIVTTQDDLFRGNLFPDRASGPAKEVARYRDALRLGWDMMRQSGGLITNRTIIEMFRLLKQRNDGFRTQAGTVLQHDRTGAVVYVPPQDGATVQAEMGRLEAYINGDTVDDLDPLIRMAVIHHQFESIHPFPDGNGRLGRILNVLYLAKSGLLEIPILYLSRPINASKAEYYARLQEVRDAGDWEGWVLYMLRAIESSADTTLALITGIRDLMAETKQRLRSQLPRLYSQDLLNNLFRHPYTRIDFVMRDLGISRPTATKYLEKLAECGMVEKHQRWRDNYYINTPLVTLLARAGAP